MYVCKDNYIIQEIRSCETNIKDAYKETKDKAFFPTKHLITRWFNIFNNEIFNNTIHPFHDIEIKRKQGCHAETCAEEDKNGNVYGTLSISERFINKNEFLYTLAHEMIHQWQWIELNQLDHGKTFWKWKNKLAQFEIPLTIKI